MGVSEPRRRRRVRRGPTLGTRRNVSVPISIGLPLTAVGIALLVLASRRGEPGLWAGAIALLVAGVAALSSGKVL